jgi:hypothetical protein
MKQKFIFLLAIFGTFILSSCTKNDPVTIGSEKYVEFDATVLNTPITGQVYPVLTRVPAYGASVVAANPTISRTSGAVKFRVNLVGVQQATDQTINYRIVASPVLPAGVSPAVAGTHYNTGTSFVIPANSSFGEITINVLNPGVSSTTPVGLVVELLGNDLVKPSENYKFLGVQINQQ